jgi:hypothetical protein
MVKSGTTRARVVVTVEPKDGPAFYKTWTGRTARRIHAAARTHYRAKFPGCRVSFGAVVYVNSYGAH